MPQMRLWDERGAGAWNAHAEPSGLRTSIAEIPAPTRGDLGRYAIIGKVSRTDHSGMMGLQRIAEPARSWRSEINRRRDPFRREELLFVGALATADVDMNDLRYVSRREER